MEVVFFVRDIDDELVKFQDVRIKFKKYAMGRDRTTKNSLETLFNRSNSIKGGLEGLKKPST